MKQLLPLFLLLASFLCVGSTLHAQFTEDFETGIPDTWTTFDNGIGTTQSWSSTTTNCGGSQAAQSRYENVSSGTAIDYLVTPLITLSATSPEVTFDFRESFGSSFGSIYSVRISTTVPNSAAAFTTLLSFSETTTNPVTCRSITVDLSAYAGQDVYVAFVHENDDGDNFNLDNVAIDGTEVPPSCTDPSATYTVVSDCDLSGGFNVEVNVSDLGSATDLTLSDNQGSATQSATAPGTFTFGPFLNGTDVIISVANDNDGTCVIMSGSLTQAVCPPVNDECVDAIALIVNADFACGMTTAGTVTGATNSNLGNGTCSGSEDDDVWYSFVATATSHRVSLLNISGFTDMYHVVYGGSCGTLTQVICSDANTSNPTGLTIGDTYYVQVYTFTSTSGQTATFDVCIGTPPPPPANDECVDATTLTINADFSCGAVDVTDLGSANSLTLSDNQGSADQTAGAPGHLHLRPLRQRNGRGHHRSQRR